MNNPITFQIVISGPASNLNYMIDDKSCSPNFEYYPVKMKIKQFHQRTFKKKKVLFTAQSTVLPFDAQVAEIFLKWFLD